MMMIQIGKIVNSKALILIIFTILIFVTNHLQQDEIELKELYFVNVVGWEIIHES